MLVSELRAIADPVSEFVAGKTSSQDKFQNICFKDNLLFGFDGEAGLTIRFQSTLNGCVNADDFVSLISKLPDSEDVLLTQSGSTITVKCASTVVEFQTTDSASFPDFIPKQFMDVGSPGDLQKVLKGCLDVSDPKSRFPGVMVRGCYVYSTDGLRAYRAKFSGTTPQGGLYIPFRSARSLVRRTLPTKLIVWNNMVGALFSDPPGLWCSTTVAGRFPTDQIDAMFVDSSTTRTEFPVACIEALKRIESLVSLSENPGVAVTSTSGSLRFEALIRSTGKIVERFSWDFPHDFAFKANPKHLRIGLTVSNVVDLSEVCAGTANQLRFISDDLQYVMGLGA